MCQIKLKDLENVGVNLRQTEVFFVSNYAVEFLGPFIFAVVVDETYQ